MLIRIVLLPIVLLLRALAWPVRALRRKRACPEGALLELTLDGAIEEGPPRPRARRWSPIDLLRRRRERRAIRLLPIGRLVDEAIADPRVAGLLVTIESPRGGWASMEALREVLARVPRAGKRLVAWLPNGGGNAAVFLASVATQIVAPPSVEIMLMGIKSERTFGKRALDKLGVDVELHARKEFKSAADGAVRTERSEADKKQTEEIVDAIDRALVAAIAERPGFTPDRARALIDEGPTRAEEMRARGLVDLVGYDDDLRALLGAKIVAAGPYFARRRAGLDRPPMFAREKSIAIVQVHGAITGAGTPIARAMGPLALQAQVVADLRAAERDPRIVGVVLDVDSRGGTVTASDAMWAAARRLAAKKPVVARMADVAASGGYYVACAARSIVARPLTITGSIGVVAARPVFGKIADRLGLDRDVITRGRFADLDAVTRPPRDDERALFSREIDAHYASFVGIVAKARGKAFDEIEPLARGRVYVGSAAHAVGLVDHLGGLDRAIEEVRKAIPAGVRLAKDPRVVSARLPSRRLQDEAAPVPASSLLESLVALVPAPLRALFAVAADSSSRAWAIGLWDL